MARRPGRKAAFSNFGGGGGVRRYVPMSILYPESETPVWLPENAFLHSDFVNDQHYANDAVQNLTTMVGAGNVANVNSEGLVATNLDPAENVTSGPLFDAITNPSITLVAEFKLIGDPAGHEFALFRAVDQEEWDSDGYIAFDMGGDAGKARATDGNAEGEVMRSAYDIIAVNNGVVLKMAVTRTPEFIAVSFIGRTAVIDATVMPSTTFDGVQLSDIAGGTAQVCLRSITAYEPVAAASLPALSA